VGNLPEQTEPLEQLMSNRNKSIDRRDFVAGSIASGAALLGSAKAWAQVVPLHCVPPLSPVQGVLFEPPTGGPVRIRKSVFELSSAEITRLKAAYAALRNVYRDDPRSWYSQGLVHCWYCSGALDNLNGMEIHGGWWFLAWHRAYLYFHERILGNLIGDPTFALPYWDWDSCTDNVNDMTGRNRFPGEVYGFPGESSNPLHDASRSAGPNDRIPPIYLGPTLMKPIMSAASFPEFGGSGNQELPRRTPAEGDAQQMGQIEQTPHGMVHVWTTDPTFASNTPVPNMGALASAAFDPVFFAHHANIDRLWDVWMQTTGHANPNNGRWLQQYFLFYDHLQTWTGILINQTTDAEASLSYRYQPPSWPAAPPAGPVPMTAPAPRIAPRFAEAAPLSAPLIELSTGTQPKILLPQPTTVQVAVPQQVKAGMTALAAPASIQKLVLRIDGVEIPADRRVIVQVYVNRPDITAAARSPERGYVGSIVIVPSTAARAGHVHGAVQRNFGFSLAPELAASLAAQDNISVTLVPVTGTTGAPPEIFRYRRVYLAAR
jgi:polyphenol oxidase